ncbi:multiple sugar transport system substrate-binding protein [Neobacillus niacini]|jgi:multiple sugar transport system substrate-binding protein|uniref:ABC transporter substrate-binding protein n=1 Tax=Neobacillus niacini TaxID=86668 RepID=UPI0027847571|nr:sugar ABC transporter substrate-binding protein [Neobacillus niacini]MDQ1004278.1 multiple sugar transport system substrate-binding protein [Neobacillus niacini]
MMKKKLSTSVLALTMATGMLLAGCGGEEKAATKNTEKAATKSDEPVTLQFWDENAGPARTPVWEEVIKRFEEKNPNIDVEYVGIPNSSAKSKYDAAIAADDTPDIGSMQTTWLPEFSIREALLPLDSYYKKSEISKKINPSATGVNKKITQDGKLYGIPYAQNLDALWIRTDWFEQAGVQEPKTWDEFFTVIEKMRDENNNRYGFTIRGGAGASFTIQRAMFAYSGLDYFDKNGKTNINDPKHVEFVEKYFSYYEKLTPKSDITNGYKEMIAGFDTGVVAMVHHNPGSYGEHNKALPAGSYKLIPLPTTDKGQYVAEGGNAVNLAIFKSTEHADEAWKFVEFVNSEESQSYWNQQTGQIPTNSDVLDDEWVQEAQHIKTAFEVYNNPDTKLYEPPFYLPDYRAILDGVVDPGVQAVMSGKMSAKDFLDEWAKAIEDSKTKYDETFKK